MCATSLIPSPRHGNARDAFAGFDFGRARDDFVPGRAAGVGRATFFTFVGAAGFATRVACF
jgi:hypothetical protein